ncbi:MAG TPA: bifunctional 3-phenylpropionate/cinnamic acid dioxygenase ferredoxin subunit [Mycobacteriales bacterium]|nr:bifunctional 3-phenylpropionate/cinnamic acid dioxygenase ferredoxin subunit [Mycobacteriales bacterium]
MIAVCPLQDLPPGTAVRLDTHVPIAVFNADGDLYAIDDTCTHQDASLADGYVEDCSVECPLHASTFDLRTGRPSGPPARTAVRTHGVTVRDGVVWVQPCDVATEATA